MIVEKTPENLRKLQFFVETQQRKSLETLLAPLKVTFATK